MFTAVSTHGNAESAVESTHRAQTFAKDFHVLLLALYRDHNSKLDSNGYSALPSPPRLMQRTHTQRDSVALSVTIPSLLAKWRTHTQRDSVALSVTLPFLLAKWRTHTQRDSVALSVTIPSLLAK